MAWPPRAGQIARASDFRKMPGVGYVRQGADQSVTSTSVVDSSIVVPVDGLITVRLSARWSSGGGGIRWTWSGAGDVSLLAREIVSAGRDATGNIHELTTMRHRQQLTLAEEQEVNHISPATSYLIQELLILDGSGSVTFQFGQQVAHANPTVLHLPSFALVQPIREL